MDNQLLPALKHKVVGHFKSHNFRNGNGNILNYIQQLEIKYHGNHHYSYWLTSIRNAINQISQELNVGSIDGNSRLRAYNNDPQLLIECQLDSCLCNITSVDLLQELLFFFEPILNANKFIIDDIYKRLNSLENMNQQQCVSLQNIEEISTHTNYKVENIDAKT